MLKGQLDMFGMLEETYKEGKEETQVKESRKEVEVINKTLERKTSKKVYSLKRLVKERLEKLDVVDLRSMGIRRIKARNKRNSIKNTVFKKVGKRLLEEYEVKGIEDIEKLEALIQEINRIGRIDLKLAYTDDYVEELGEKEVRFVKELINPNTADTVEKHLSIRIEEDGLFKDTIHTHLILVENDLKSGIYRYRSGGKYFHNFVELDLILGIAYVFNNIYHYMKTHEFIYLYKTFILENTDKKISLKDEETITYLKERLDFHNIDRTGYTFEIEGNLDINSIKGIIGLDDFFLKHSETRLSSSSSYRPDLYSYYYFSQTKGYKLGNILTYLYHIIDLNEEVEVGIKTEKDNSDSYARSYETKKNIPDKVVEAMKQSVFSDYFSFVEFDELVDLDKIKVLEEDWLKLMSFIDIEIANNHSLRFRRLGHYKAGGLYFPSAKAVCVDINTPKSLLHEVMHMVDYTYREEQISLSDDFYPIVEKYKEVFLDKLDDLGDGIKKELSRKGKYNKDYYFLKTEIFARTGELYIYYKYNLNLNILKNMDEQVGLDIAIYPKDEDLKDMIIKFFDKLFLN